MTKKNQISVSLRGTNMPESPIRKLKPFADKAQAAGKKIYHLNIGQPDIETPPQMFDALKNYENKIVAYGPSQGLPEYQDALIKYYAKYNISLKRDDIIVTTGGSEAIIMGLTICLDPGDEIIVPEPFYANYNGFATAASVIIKPITTRLEDDWALPSPAAFEKLIGPKTRAIMICNPNNPTGKLYSKEDLSALAQLAQKHNLFLFGDEVYREFIYTQEKHTSLMHFPEIADRVIIMDSISKRYSACGSRIGAFISKNPQIMKAALCFAQARLCPPTIDQVMAIPTVDLDDKYFASMVAEYKARRDAVLAGLSSMEGVKYKTPLGAFYIIVKLPVDNAEKFVTWLLSDFEIDGETVMLAPANGFYNTKTLGHDEIRIAFVLNVAKTKKAMNIFAQGLKKYQSMH
ncbi:MAG TPA: pyridoxal phosphate-dependent aminotransferase [Bacteriovoracaceae bacterium]|nr:pyridoxal phosphate-dependent aminotransferase [Bacteriovoracaceae bacterium]